jgi:hypothetical protein
LIELPDGSTKSHLDKKWFTSAQCFYERDLYSTQMTWFSLINLRVALWIKSLRQSDILACRRATH